jgi:hypothetical protein
VVHNADHRSGGRAATKLAGEPSSLRSDMYSMTPNATALGVSIAELFKG